MNKTIKAYKEAKEKQKELHKEMKNLPSDSPEWGLYNSNLFQQETKKQTSKTALKEMKELLEDEIGFLENYFRKDEFGGVDIKLIKLKRKLNKIDKVLEKNETKNN